MKTDKTKLLQDIKAMKVKLASMEEELNKVEIFKHFPSRGDIYYFYTPNGTVCRNIASNDILKINVLKSTEEARQDYNKKVAIEKVKRRVIELQGDWKPDFNDASTKYTIRYDHEGNSFEYDGWQKVKDCVLIPYMKTSEIAKTIINEMEDELKLIFDIA